MKLSGSRHTLLWIFLLTVVMFSCFRVVEQVQQNPGDGAYLSAYPIRNTAEYLEIMQQSVKRITSTSYYTTFLFDPGDMVQKEDLEPEGRIRELAITSFNSQSSSAGTAIVIHNQRNRIGLLTTWHVIASPDTLFEYNDTEPSYLQSVAIRNSQINWLFDTPFMGTFEVLATDRDADLAVIGAELNQGQQQEPVQQMFPLFPSPLGQPHQLRPGVFLYTIGYPRGYPMVTTGIVSDPGRDRHHTFVTDVLFNPGISGAAVVAIRGGVPAFELLGMARSASATRNWIITPDEGLIPDQIQHLPYKGELFMEQMTRIDYGITHVIPATRIQDFLRQNQATLSGMGYDVRPLLENE